MSRSDRIAEALRSSLNAYEWHLALAAIRKSARAGTITREDAGRLYRVARKAKTTIKAKRVEARMVPWPKILGETPTHRRLTSRMFD